ncbi:calmodulin-regulated spectrin-associated protein 2a isoform X7 [Brienomyrus brachyistius]|uniref:calmodulin-regulated spectrin-associated protein 2a isoform X7 n=1 Tax=Brienomyrus brachyistius TaxID=42636 RepID=UPI0020B3020C|nr:calmodulin-regulated spectrin-associated protein 2a isoform X7 [Brienomyrus brachyistius]
MGDAAESRETKKTCIVPAIKPFDHYDFGRAKICCSLTWLVAKAYGADSIPADMKEPFYTDQYEQEHMKPAMAELLLSAELYCRAGSLILRSDATKPLLGHEAVIRALAQRGLYVTDQERLVTERDLRKKPIQLSAHLTMIDSLMMAYTMETVSVEKVVSCVRQYASLYPDSDVPYDTEDAVMSWINKVNEYLKDIIVNEQKMRENRSAEPSTGPRARYRKEQALPDQAPWIPPVDNLLKDCADGCALAALLHFYCPDIVKLEDICLKKTMPLADSLYNLQLIQDFCEEYLNRCCHFTVEDMLYTASSIKNNFLVFMAELFWWFEVVKPPFVRPRVLDPEGPELSPVLKSMPSVSISNVTRRSFMEKPPPSDRPSLPLKPQPQSSASGAIARSASMSLADSAVGSWPKEKRSSAQAVSFDIPLDKENTTEASTPPDPEMNRSISTDGLSFKVNYTSRSLKRNLSFQPVNGLSKAEGIDEEEGFPGRPHSETQPRTAHPRNLQDFPNGQALDEHGELVATPSIEEALKIIHNSAKSQNSFHDGQESNGFFLHSQDRGALASRMRTDNGDFDSVSESKWAVTPDTTEVDTGIHVKTEDIQETLDEDSSLRDYTMSMDLDMDHDYDTRACPQDTPSPSTSLISGKSPAGSTTSTSSGVKMTSFAEQKFKKLNQTEGKNSGGSSQKTTPESAEINVPHMVSWAITPQASPTPQSPKDPAQEMASEMVQLKMKLEEKRRAIEAQKKKVEAAFSRHRQRMGRSAFLTVVKNKDDGASAFREESVGIEDGKLSADPQSHDRNLQARMGKLDVPDGAEQSQARLLKSPNEDGFGEADLLEYTKSIEKLNASLNFLQTEMQRLAQQQEVIMQMREQQSWVISPSQPSPQKQVRELRQAARSSGSPSPADSPHITHLSPTNVKKKSASFHLKSQRTPRPIELKITPFSRVLTVPQSVDSLPRLRRFSPSQAQVSSFAYLGEDAKPSMATETTEKHLHQAKPHGVTKSLPASPTKEVRPKQPESTAAEVGSDKVANQENVEFKPIESTVSEVLSQPITETFTITSSGSPADITAQSTSSLIEVPLSVLKPLDGQILDYSRERSGDVYEDDQKMCCGFFFKDDMKGEDDMAVKRAALFEKRLRRERETQQKKQQLEAEMEQKKEEARMKAEEERQKKEDEKARREFIKQEYLRRKQLKLMEDMETVIKARPAGGKQKKPRPRSIHRDSLESPKAGAGSRPRVFSVSSLSLASLNLRDDASMQSDKRSPRSDSADGFLSPCRTGSRNGEREWENASTTSSVTSNTEYTGPKLYKEPSAKSNKHIIQNALSHCCLAGKVNEGQKNKILEEMEKSEANNFLILFRDSGCQFRSLYTYWPEMKEITKLVGIGPKSINRKMIEGLYKYNSDRKQFSHIPAKTMSASVDAITIHGHLWQTKKPVTPKKVSIQS